MKQKKKKFDRKISNKTATWTILVFLLVCCSLVWKVSSYQRSFENSLQNGTAMAYARKSVSKNNPDMSAKSNCIPHYYEGQAAVNAWAKQINDDGIIVQIDPKDESSLPIKDPAYKNQQQPLSARLVDATTQVKKELTQATEKTPAQITVKGYAEICQDNPAISLEPATLAFKKNSSGS